MTCPLIERVQNVRSTHTEWTRDHAVDVRDGFNGRVPLPSPKTRVPVLQQGVDEVHGLGEELCTHPHCLVCGFTAPSSLSLLRCRCREFTVQDGRTHCVRYQYFYTVVWRHGNGHPLLVEFKGQVLYGFHRLNGNGLRSLKN